MYWKRRALANTYTDIQPDRAYDWTMTEFICLEKPVLPAATLMRRNLANTKSKGSITRGYSREKQQFSVQKLPSSVDPRLTASSPDLFQL